MFVKEPGFVNYGLVDAGNHKVVALSIWETREEAQKSASVAATWIKENIADRVRLLTTYDRRACALPRRPGRRLVPPADRDARSVGLPAGPALVAIHRPSRPLAGAAFVVRSVASTTSTGSTRYASGQPARPCCGRALLSSYGRSACDGRTGCPSSSVRQRLIVSNVLVGTLGHRIRASDEAFRHATSSRAGCSCGRYAELGHPSATIALQTAVASDTGCPEASSAVSRRASH